MSLQVDTAWVQTYHDNVSYLVQQKGSRFRPFVRVERQQAEFDFYDRIGSTEAQEITGRHQDTPLTSTPHDRRRVGLRDFDWADLIDRQDKLRMLIDPTSSYAQNAMWAMGRKMDDIVIESAFATAYTGKTGSGTATFPSSQQVAVDYVETGSTANSSLTIGKLRRAKEILDANENDEEELRVIAVSAQMLHALLRTTEVTSADYNIVKALVNGQIDTFLGFKFIRTQRLATNASGYRRAIAWCKSKLLLAVSQEIMVDVGPRRDKRNSVQVYVSMGIGATRMEEEGVVEIICDETVL